MDRKSRDGNSSHRPSRSAQYGVYNLAPAAKRPRVQAPELPAPAISFVSSNARYSTPYDIVDKPAKAAAPSMTTPQGPASRNASPDSSTLLAPVVSKNAHRSKAARAMLYGPNASDPKRPQRQEPEARRTPNMPSRPEKANQDAETRRTTYMSSRQEKANQDAETRRTTYMSSRPEKANREAEASTPALLEPIDFGAELALCGRHESPEGTPGDATAYAGVPKKIARVDVMKPPRYETENPRAHFLFQQELEAARRARKTETEEERLKRWRRENAVDQQKAELLYGEVEEMERIIQSSKNRLVAQKTERAQQMKRDEAAAIVRLIAEREELDRRGAQPRVNVAPPLSKVAPQITKALHVPKVTPQVTHRAGAERRLDKEEDVEYTSDHEEAEGAANEDATSAFSENEWWDGADAEKKDDEDAEKCAETYDEEHAGHAEADEEDADRIGHDDEDVEYLNEDGARDEEEQDEKEEGEYEEEEQEQEQEEEEEQEDYEDYDDQEEDEEADIGDEDEGAAADDKSGAEEGAADEEFNFVGDLAKGEPDDWNDEEGEPMPFLTGEGFDSLDLLSPKTLRGLQDMELEYMASVQQMAIPRIMSGANVLVLARSGTGKTLSYLIPIVEKVMNDVSAMGSCNGVYALVLAANREAMEHIRVTAMQLEQHYGAGFTTCCRTLYEHESIEKRPATDNDYVISHHTDVGLLLSMAGRVLNIMVGKGKGKEKRSTPGFRESFMTRMKGVQMCVVDEIAHSADQGKSGSGSSVHKLVRQLSRKHLQFVLLSAIDSKTVRSTVDLNMPRDYEVVNCMGSLEERGMADVEQGYVVCRPNEILSELALLIEQARAEQVESYKVMVFGNCARLQDIFSRVFEEAGFQNWNTSTHEKSNRSSSIRSFRDAMSGILFCSESAVRGVNIPNVTHVIQVGAPANGRAVYVNCVGHTGRAGNPGTGILLLQDYETEFLHQLHAYPLFKRTKLSKKSEEWTTYDWLGSMRNIPHLYRCGAYRSFLQSTKRLWAGRLKKSQIVEHANSFAEAVLGFDEPPALPLTFLQQMALEFTPGVRMSGGNEDSHLFRTHNFRVVGKMKLEDEERFRWIAKFCDGTAQKELARKNTQMPAADVVRAFRKTWGDRPTASMLKQCRRGKTVDDALTKLEKLRAKREIRSRKQEGVLQNESKETQFWRKRAEAKARRDGQPIMESKETLFWKKRVETRELRSGRSRQRSEPDAVKRGARSASEGDRLPLHFNTADSAGDRGKTEGDSSGCAVMTMGDVKCYSCGETGHFHDDCPRKGGKSGGGKGRRRGGRN